MGFVDFSAATGKLRASDTCIKENFVVAKSETYIINSRIPKLHGDWVKDKSQAMNLKQNLVKITKSYSDVLLQYSRTSLKL